MSTHDYFDIPLPDIFRMSDGGYLPVASVEVPDTHDKKKKKKKAKGVHTLTEYYY